MKSSIKTISLILVVVLCVVFAGCEKQESNKTAQMTLQNYFYSTSTKVEIPAKLMVGGALASPSGFVSMESFSVIKEEIAKNNSEFKVRELGKYCILLTTGENGSVRHYLLTLSTDVNCDIFVPSVSTEYTNENGHLKFDGEKLYFPIFMIEPKDKKNAKEFLSIASMVKPNEYYSLNCSVEDFKAFYAETGGFVLQDTENGFTLSMANDEKALENTYQFQFKVNGDNVEVIYSIE